MVECTPPRAWAPWPRLAATPGMGVDVHVLPTASCDEEEVAAAADLLDAEERRTFDAFLLADDARLYALAHGLLRRVLAARLGRPPADLRFVVDEPGGKPRLAGHAVSFNLSHTRGLVAVAVADAGAVGIDVERLDAAVDPAGLAAGLFARREADDVAAAPAPARRERFTRYWTLKESYVKARGLGFACPLEAFAFELSSPIRITMDPELGDSPARWAFAQQRVGPDHILALCAERLDGR